MTPHSRLVWTNEDGGDGGFVTTVTFEEQGGKTLLVVHELDLVSRGPLTLHHHYGLCTA